MTISIRTQKDRVRSTWTAAGGMMAGPFYVNGKPSVRLGRNTKMCVLDDDTVTLRADYQPPGTVFFALVAAILTGAAIAIVYAPLGFMAIPLWIIWYFVIAKARQVTFKLNLHDAKAIGTDESSSRIAIATRFMGHDQWFAVELKHGYDIVVKQLQGVTNGNLQECRITKPSSIPIVLLSLLIAGLLAIVAMFATRPF